MLDLQATPLRLNGDLVAAPSLWPLRDDSIDRIVLQHAVEVVPDVDALLDEALRVLKPERRILLLTVGALGLTQASAPLAASKSSSLVLVPHTGMLPRLTSGLTQRAKPRATSPSIV